MFRLALKNILFYKARSITTFLLTFFSLFLFIIYVAFMNGSHNSMLKNSLDIYTGSIQIYQKDYRDEGGYDYLIYDNEKINKILEKTDGIDSFSSRLETFGILSSKDKSSAVMLTGINFKKEEKISKLKEGLKSGKYITTGNCLYMGEDLANKLNLKLYDKVSFIGNAIDYSFVADIFKLCATFKTGMFEVDSGAAFLNREYFDTLFYSKNTSTYIVVKVKDLDKNDLIAKQISSKLGSEYRLYTWQELMKAMVELIKVDSIFGYISMGLFFLVIFFVIMIYGFINVSSRIKEFGTLKSIGLKDSDIDLLLFYEMLILTIFAISFALPIASYLTYYYEINPIIIEGISEMYKDYGYISDEVPTSFNIFTITWNTLTIFFLNMLSILYPVYFVRSFTPIEAMKHV